MDATVVDASVLVELSGERGEQIWSRLGDDWMHAPQVALIETANALRRSARTDRRAADAAGHWLAELPHLTRLSLHPHGPLLPRIWELRGQFTAYDASYVALAEWLQSPLLTLDRRLARAAADLVEVIVPD